jgi:hypothetical protein
MEKWGKKKMRQSKREIFHKSRVFVLLFFGFVLFYDVLTVF